MTKNDGDDGGRAPTFSQRHGYKPFNTEIQIESLNDRTRMDIWNAFVHPLFIAPMTPVVDPEIVWAAHLARERHRYHPSPFEGALHDIVFGHDWYLVYDLLEFLVQSASPHRIEDLQERMNLILAANRAGYRIVDTYFVPISNPAEAAAIETAASSPLREAREHIRRAIALFAVRDNPNFAKAIQEAMSAAEAAANHLAYTEGKTLAEALTIAQRRNVGGLHASLVDGWKMLYGFTSDSGGIRHALKDGSIEPDQNLCQYFVITCSAFVNFVVAATANRVPTATQSEVPT